MAEGLTLESTSCRAAGNSRTGGRGGAQKPKLCLLQTRRFLPGNKVAVSGHLKSIPDKEACTQPLHALAAACIQSCCQAVIVPKSQFGQKLYACSRMLPVVG